MVGLGRLELPTSRLSSARSNQLSYRPDIRAKKGGTSLQKSAPAKQGFRPGPKLPTSEPWKGYVDGGPTDVDPMLLDLVPGLPPRRGLLSKSNIQRLDKSNLTRRFLRKEVIQPQVLLRLPCYDFTPVVNQSLGACLPKVSSATSALVGSHGVTGGVYKARERIHRGVLIRDY